MKSESSGAWTRQTKDYWFYGFLATSCLSIVLLFSPFLYVLLFAAVTVVVTWPIYCRLLYQFGGRRFVAALSALLMLGFAVFLPLFFVGQLFALEAIEVGGRWGRFLSSGGFEQKVNDFSALLDSYQTPWILELRNEILPNDLNVLGTVMGPIKDAAILMINTAGSLVPTLVSIVANGAIDAAIFLFAVITFYMEGPRLLRVFANLSPMEDAYELRLFEVFREFATNLVVGSLATAVLQGVVASIGYLIAGVEGVIFFGLLTAVFSFVPVVGTVLVWLPLSISVGMADGWAWAGFLVLWSVLFTGTVDNLVKPLFLRGSSDIHPLLIFLAVFGGMAWMQLPGILIGPVLVAFFLSLYTIYCEDYLGLPAESAPSGQVEHKVVPSENEVVQLPAVTSNQTEE